MKSAKKFWTKKINESKKLIIVCGKVESDANKTTTNVCPFSSKYETPRHAQSQFKSEFSQHIGANESGGGSVSGPILGPVVNTQEVKMYESVLHKTLSRSVTITILAIGFPQFGARLVFVLPPLAEYGNGQ